jgi:hypothetical protein
LIVGELFEKNYKAMFQNQQCTIYYKNRGNMVITIVSMSNNRMFPLMFGEHNNYISNLAYEEKSWLWNLTYGHLIYYSFMFLTSKELVYGFPKLQECKKVCEICAKGKHARDNFSIGNA